jgi:hypothetical protein
MGLGTVSFEEPGPGVYVHLQICSGEDSSAEITVLHVAVLDGGHAQIHACKKESHVVTTPGTDVMITIFCNFRQFLAKKLAFFSKPIVTYDQNFAYFSFVLSRKR